MTWLLCLALKEKDSEFRLLTFSNVDSHRLDDVAHPLMCQVVVVVVGVQRWLGAVEQCLPEMVVVVKTLSSDEREGAWGERV